MRIRKNARLVTSSSSSSSFLVCQLNRSPWDVDSFSFQGEWQNGFDSTDNLAQLMPSSNSLYSMESMELSFEYVEKSVPQPPPPPSPEVGMEERENAREEERIGGHNDDNGRNNNKNNGWQHIHHQLKPPPLKVGSPPLPPVPAAPKKRGRPKKPTMTMTTTTTTNTAPTITATPTANSNNNNPYEFYYYSGFGPSWASKRRGGKKHTPTSVIAGDDGTNCENAIINDGDESAGCSSSSLVMSEDDEDNKNTSSNADVVVMENVVEGELDYIEDDFDDDDEDNNLGSGRRVRKPVKARSLKSLM